MQKEEYSNFGYDVLRLLIARTTGRPVADYVRHELCRPYGFNELEGDPIAWRGDSGGAPTGLEWCAASTSTSTHSCPPPRFALRPRRYAPS